MEIDFTPDEEAAPAAPEISFQSDEDYVTQMAKNPDFDFVSYADQNPDLEGLAKKGYLLQQQLPMTPGRTLALVPKFVKGATGMVADVSSGIAKTGLNLAEQLPPEARSAASAINPLASLLPTIPDDETNRQRAATEALTGAQMAEQGSGHFIDSIFGKDSWLQRNVFNPVEQWSVGRATQSEDPTIKANAETRMAQLKDEETEAPEARHGRGFDDALANLKKTNKLTAGIPSDEGLVAGGVKLINKAAGKLAGVPEGEMPINPSETFMSGPEIEKQFGAGTGTDPQTIAQIGAATDPVSNLTPLHVPGASQVAGGALKVVGKTLKAPAAVAEAVGGGRVGKMMKYGIGGGAAVLAVQNPEEAAKVLGGVVLLKGAKMFGGLLDNAGSKLINPKSVTKAGRAAGQELIDINNAGGGSKFFNPKINKADLETALMRPISGAAQGAAGMVPIAAATTDTPEQFTEAVGGGTGFGMLAGGINHSPFKGFRPEHVQAVDAVLRDNGKKDYGDPLDAEHNAYLKSLSQDQQDGTNAFRGFFQDFKLANGNEPRIFVLPSEAFAREVNRNRPDITPEQAAQQRGYVAEDGRVFINGDAGGSGRTLAHESGHVVENILRTVQPEVIKTMRASAEKGLLKDGKPTPELQRFIDQYNKQFDPSGKTKEIDGDNDKAVSEWLAEQASEVLEGQGPAKYAAGDALREKITDNLGDYFKSLFGTKNEFDRESVPQLAREYRQMLYELGRFKGAEPVPGTPAGPDSGPEPGPRPAGPAAPPATPDAKGVPIVDVQAVNRESRMQERGVRPEVVDKVRGEAINEAISVVEQAVSKRKKRPTQAYIDKLIDKAAKEAEAEFDQHLDNYLEALEADGATHPEGSNLKQAMLLNELGGLPARPRAAKPLEAISNESKPTPTPGTPEGKPEVPESLPLAGLEGNQGTNAKGSKAAGDNVAELEKNIGKGIYLRDYNSAAQEGHETGQGLDLSGEKRADELKLSPTGETGQRKGAVTKQDKAFTPFKVVETAKGQVVLGFDHDKFLDNTRKILDATDGTEIDTGFEGIKGKDLDKAISKAFAQVAENHANGYSGTGEKLPADLGLPPIEGYVPHEVNPQQAATINMAMHIRAKGGPEVNKLRGALEAAGFETGRQLKTTVSNIRPDLIEGGVHSTPTHGRSVHAHGFDIPASEMTRKLTPHGEPTKAGFLPGKLSELDKSTRRIKEGIAKDVGRPISIPRKAGEGDQSTAPPAYSSNVSYPSEKDLSSLGKKVTLSTDLKPGDKVNWDGQSRTVSGIREVPGFKREARHWLDFEDGTSTKIYGRTEVELDPSSIKSKKYSDHAIKSGSEYQGESGGLHAFIERTTNGNFSIPEGEVTAERVQAEADKVRKSFEGETVTEDNLDDLLRSMGALPPKDKPLAALEGFKPGEDPSREEELHKIQKQIDSLWYTRPRDEKRIQELKDRQSELLRQQSDEAPKKEAPKPGELEVVPSSDKDELPEGHRRVAHWSPVKDLAEVDPKFHGKGRMGAERKRKAEFPDRYPDRSYFGYGNYRQESGIGNNRYAPDMDFRLMYDYPKDTLDLWPLAEREAGEGASDAAKTTEYERLIKEHGYLGYFNDNAQVAAVFHKVPSNGSINSEAFAKSAPDYASRSPDEIRATYESKAEKPAESNSNDKGSFMPAPETPEFKKWFGDSKVVDENGKPRVMHHGTYADFDAFKRRPGDIGIHFGDADTASDRVAYGVPHRQPEEGGARTIPVYLSIKNPLRMPDVGFWNPENMNSILKEKFPMDAKLFGPGYRGAYGLTTPTQVREFLQQHGYDGIVYKNSGEVTGAEPFREKIASAQDALEARFGKGKNSFSVEDQKTPEFQAYSEATEAYRAHRESAGTDSYIAFEPTQIKSATANSGAFDPKNKKFNFLPGKADAFIDKNSTLDEVMRAEGENIHIVTPSAKVKGKWQSTEYWVEDGKLTPIGDTQFDTREEAVSEFEGRNYKAVSEPETSKVFDSINLDADTVGGSFLPGKEQSKLEADDNKFRISTARPWGKTTDFKDEGQLAVSAKPFRENKLLADKANDIIRGFPSLKLIYNRNPQKTIDGMIDHGVENLLWLHDKFDPKLRDTAKLWYDGARKITERWAKEYGHDRQSIAATLAALSPQLDWYQNVSLAKRVLDVYRDQQDTTWTPEMDQAVKRISKAVPKLPELVKPIRGRKFSDLDVDEKAIFTRMFDEAHNSRDYPIVSPDGEFKGTDTNDDGSPAKVSWRSFEPIGKAIASIEDGSHESISYNMGTGHKVRNFYNNIILPNDPSGAVTIDTHAVAALIVTPIAAKDKEANFNFQGISNNFTGTKGLYGINAEAYRKAAMARNLLPREMQSITWEAIRGLFPDVYKTAKTKDETKAIWKDVAAGKITKEQALEKIFEKAGGINTPSWAEGRHGDKADEKGGNTRDQGKLSKLGVSGEAGGRAKRGGGGKPAGELAEL